MRAPVLLLCGESDQLVPPECSQRLQSTLPNAELHTVPRTSHQLMQEQPDVVNGLIDGFFEKAAEDNLSDR